MKKIILLVLTTLMMVGCDVKQPDGTYKPSSYRTYIIDSCEYVGCAMGSQSDYLAHKGNCRFCKERRQKELEELVIKLKEK
jgi:hypothetical protein